LPGNGWILGVDEHTALVVDVAAAEGVVTGRGGVTVRRRGRARRFESGTRLPLAALAEAAHHPAGAVGQGTGRAAAGGASTGPGGDLRTSGSGSVPPARSPLLAEVSRLERAFEGAVAGRRADEAAAAILELDRVILDWSADTLQSDEPDRARAVLHALVHRLGETAAIGLRDPRETLRPIVEALIAVRADLRASRLWEAADRLRAGMAAAGIELRDTPEGPVWVAKPPQTSR